MKKSRLSFVKMDTDTAKVHQGSSSAGGVWEEDTNSPDIYDCRIFGQIREVVSPTGRNTVSRQQIYIKSLLDITSDSRVSLPPDTSFRRISSFETFADRDGQGKLTILYL